MINIAEISNARLYIYKMKNEKCCHAVFVWFVFGLD